MSPAIETLMTKKSRVKMKQSGAMDPFIIASKILSIGCNTDAATHNQSTDAGITESVSRHSEMEVRLSNGQCHMESEFSFI